MLRRGTILLLFLLTPAAAAAATGVAPRVPWLEDLPWEAVLQRADAGGGLPILIDFYATWCGPCKLLDAMVYNDRDVLAELKDVVPFKVDIDKPRYRELKERFGIIRLPTTVWCDADGREVDRFTGFVDRIEFLRRVRAFRDGRDTFRDVLARQGAAPQDPRLLLDLADRLRVRERDREAGTLYRRLLNRDDDLEPLWRSGALLGLADLERRAGRDAEARGLARRAADLFTPATPGGAEGLRTVGRFQETLGDSLGLLRTWRLLAAADDRDVEALDGFARAALAAGVELEGAAAAALRAVILSGKEPRTVETLAECYFRMGQYAKAIRWMGEAIARAPAETRYRERLEAFEAARREDPYGLRGGGR